VILILGLAGLFGAGPLSKGTVSDEQDILYSARKEHGLERLDRIKYATPGDHGVHLDHTGRLIERMQNWGTAMEPPAMWRRFVW
jgi:hypothetical protein